MLNNPIGVPDCPCIRSRTPSDPSGPGGGHPSHPQDPAAPPLTTASRRHFERPRPAGRLRVTTTCHHRPTQPVTVPPGCVCRAGRGWGSHDEPFRGCPRPPRAIWGGAVLIRAARRPVWPFLGGKKYFFLFLVGLKVFIGSGRLCPMVP